MLIALLCESEMKLADETIEMILDKVSCCIRPRVRSKNNYMGKDYQPTLECVEA